MKTYQSQNLPAPHRFFTRNGGVSSGLFTSLNCSFSTDDPQNVRANRAIVAQEMGLERRNLLGCKQVHGIDVALVQEPWAEGAGATADAMVSNVPGLGLGIITADCAPVLFCGNGVAGAAHAGWRGAVAGVLEATIAAMQKLGAVQIHAVVGPCIQQASYEIGADMRDAVLAAGHAAEEFFKPGRPGHWQFDLPGYCVARLTAAGVNAASLGLDTCALEQEFFSHRRRTLRKETVLGHQISVIRS